MAASPARHAPARRAPARRAPARPAPARRPSTSPKPSTRGFRPRGAAVLDALLHGRGWIALVFVLLAGIVFFNVDLLRMNREIAVAADAASEMKRDNARLRALTARLGSSERIQEVAARTGLVLPAPGDVRYLRSNPAVDDDNAVRRLEDGSGVAAAPVVPDPVEVVPEPVVPAPVEVVPEPVEAVPVEPVPEEPVEPVVPEVDPTTGVSYDPVTGAPIDPATGAPPG